LKFDRIVSHGRTLRFNSHLRALASMVDVYEAQMPTANFDDYGTSTSDWTTVQVGGDVVYRGDGQVLSQSGDRVGTASDAGYVVAKLQAVPKLGCLNDGPEQALWVFSSSACGTYGFNDLRIDHSGQTAPVGEIALSSPRQLYVPGGSGWLLRVD
jgi:hypothetical protein